MWCAVCAYLPDVEVHSNQPHKKVQQCACKLGHTAAIERAHFGEGTAEANGAAYEDLKNSSEQW
jgi:hypothetical protein